MMHAFFTKLLQINLLLVLAYIILAALQKAAAYKMFKVSSAHQLKIAYGLLAGSILLPSLFQVAGDFKWSSRISHQSQSFATMEEIPWVVYKTNSNAHFDPRHIQIIEMIVLISFVLGLIFFLREILGIQNMLVGSQVYKRIGRLQLLVSYKDLIPSSYSKGFNSFVIIPQMYLSDKKIFSHCLKHELQHIRQKDTLWIYLVVLTEKTLILNPFAFLFVNHIKRLQEEACDEELIMSNKVNKKEYAQSLLDVLEVSARTQQFRLAPSILSPSNQKQLIRRIKTMTQIQPKTNYRALLIAVTMTFLVLVSGAQYSKAVQIKEKNDSYVMIRAVVKENGQIVSRPSIVTTAGEEAQIVVMNETGEGKYLNIQPGLILKGNQLIIESEFEYGNVLAQQKPDQKLEKEKIGYAKVLNLVRVDGNPLEGGPEKAKISFQNVEIELMADLYEPTKK